MAVAALVCGLCGIVVGVIPLFFLGGWLLGVLAWVFGVVGRRRAKANPARGGKGMATWGIVLGVAAIIFGFIGLAVLGDAFDEINQDSVGINSTSAVISSSVSS